MFYFYLKMHQNASSGQAPADGAQRSPGLMG